MPYHIHYDTGEKTENKSCIRRRLLLSSCFFLIFLFFAFEYWPSGMNTLKQVLFPEATLQAAEVFAQELMCGYSLADAARNFCMMIKTNGLPG